MPSIPDVDKCCGCVTDLKTAVAIIAVLGIVTSPAVSWAVVRHSYVIRMSCFVTTSAQRADVVDISLNNMLSFGFGANAGLGPSCLSPKNTTVTKPPDDEAVFRHTETGNTSGFVSTVRWVGWIVLFADFIFLGFSIYFLYKLFRVYPSDRELFQTKTDALQLPPTLKNTSSTTVVSSTADAGELKPLPRRLAENSSYDSDSSSAADIFVLTVTVPRKSMQIPPYSLQPPDAMAAQRFMKSCVLAIFLSFLYGMLYVAACVQVGGAFPVFELIFCFVDVMIISMWIHFILVLRTYSRKPEPEQPSQLSKFRQNFPPFSPMDLWTMLNQYISAALGYILLVINILLIFSVDLLFNSSSFLQTQVSMTALLKIMVK